MFITGHWKIFCASVYSSELGHACDWFSEMCPVFPARPKEYKTKKIQLKLIFSYFSISFFPAYPAIFAQPLSLLSCNPFFLQYNILDFLSSVNFFVPKNIIFSAPPRSYVIFTIDVTLHQQTTTTTKCL